MARRHIREVDPHTDGPVQVWLDEHDTALDTLEQNSGGIPSDDDPEDIAATADPGVSEEYSRADHVHGGAFAPGGGRRILLSNAAGDDVTDSADLTWHDTNKTLTLGGADPDVVMNASSGNAQIDLQKAGVSYLKMRTGTAAASIDFGLANALNYITIAGTTGYLGIANNGHEVLFKATQIDLPDAHDVVLGTGTGTKWGTATGQKQAWWGATPVVQQVLATGGGATVDNVISLLQTLGLCKQS